MYLNLFLFDNNYKYVHLASGRFLLNLLTFSKNESKDFFFLNTHAPLQPKSLHALKEKKTQGVITSQH